MKNMKAVASIDEYMGGYPPEVQQVLKKMRQTIKKAAPQATEAISYGIPTFKLNGNLVHFGAFKNHLSFFPTGAGVEAFQNELSAYEISKGTIKFPYDKPIPFDLVAKIVKFRVQQNLAKAAEKKK